jgi:hypothetical protein
MVGAYSSEVVEKSSEVAETPCKDHALHMITSRGLHNVELSEVSPSLRLLPPPS